MENHDSLGVITQRKPYIVEFLKINDHNLFQILPARKRGVYISYKNISLSSQIDSVIEAERILDRIKFHPEKIIILLGAGNIHLIEKIIELRKKNQITLLIEWNSRLISFLIRKSQEFQNFLKIPNCHVFSYENQMLLWNYLNSLPVEKMKGFLFIIHPPSFHMHQEFYKNIEFQIQSIFKSNFSSLLTKFEFENLWFRNIFLNLKLLHKDVWENRLIYYKDLFKDIPFSIIGAGPTLQKSREILEYLQKTTFMIATDASLKPLLKMKIKPHAVHVLDAQQYAYFHLRGIDLRDIILFADIVINPFLIYKLKPKIWIFSSTAKYFFNHEGFPIKEQTPGMLLMENLVGELGAIQSGGSVATSAFEIARFLGAEKIFLVGVDLSWTNRQLHSIGTYHYENWIGKIHRLETLENINESIFQKRIRIPVRANNGKETYGDHVMNLYRLWFEESLKEMDISVYNCSLEGAKIENTISLKSMEEIINLRHLENIIKERFYFYIKNYKFQYYFHEELEKIVLLLKKLLKEYDKEFYLFLLELYPDLKVFSHKVETYILRNQTKLNKEKIDKLRLQEIKKQIQIFIKFYNSFNISRIH